MIRALPVLALSAALAALAPAAANAQTPVADAAFQTTTLDLSAYGEVRVAPDLATITLGVTTEAGTATEALRLNRAQMNATVAQLRAQGVADKDIQTSGLNLNPKYAYEQNQPPRLTGYEASNQVTVSVHDLARLGPLVDAVVAAGANRINGIGFGLQNPRSAEDDARRQAVRALQAKAELYAAATGYRIRRLVSLSEGAGEVTPPRPFPVVEMAVRASRPTAIEPGELKVRVDVSGVFELTR